jgi:hypothetical protein
MKWLAELFALAWAVSILLVIFLGPFVAVAVLVSYLWGMI